MSNAQEWISRLQLEAHPEGGYYREHYRADLTLEGASLPDTYGGARSACTSIYYLLESGDFSAFHRIVSDELWHFYDGEALEIFVITPEGELVTHRLGRAENESLFAMVPGGCWFASRPAEKSAYCLVGCTVAPGFDFADFEIADRQFLSEKFGLHSELVRMLTRA